MARAVAEQHCPPASPALPLPPAPPSPRRHADVRARGQRRLRRRAVVRCRQCSRAVLGAAATEGFIGFHAHPVSPENKTAKPLRRKAFGAAGRGGAGLPVAWLPRDGTRAATSSQPTSKAPAHTPTATPSWRQRRRRRRRRKQTFSPLPSAVGDDSPAAAQRDVSEPHEPHKSPGINTPGGTPRGAPAAWTSWPIVGPGTATELRGACESGSAARVTLKRKPAAAQAVPQPR